MTFLLLRSGSGEGDPKLTLQHIPGAAADKNTEQAVLQAVLPLVVIEAQARLWKREADLPLLPCRKAEATVVLQLLDRTHEAGRHILDIELRDLGSRATAKGYERLAQWKLEGQV